MNKKLPQEIYLVGSYYEYGNERVPILIGNRDHQPHVLRRHAEEKLRRQHKLGRIDAKLLIGTVTWTEED